MPSYVSHLECSYTGKQFEIGGVRTVSEFGKPLLVRYDLDRLGMGVSREDIGFNRFWCIVFYNWL